MRVARAAVGGVVLGCALAGSVGATAQVASASPSNGQISVYVTPSNGAKSKIVITGAIGDYGTATSVDQNGKVDQNGNFVVIALKKGTFKVDSTALNQAANNVQPTVNTTTCSATGTGSGSVTLMDGTGLYAGISGTINITETFAFVGPPFKSGSKKGQCNLGNNAQPLAQYASLTGSGAVTFSS